MLVTSCKNCGNQNNPKNRFCTECGISLIVKAPVRTTDRITERTFSIGDRCQVHFERKFDENDKFVITVFSNIEVLGLAVILEFTRNQSLNIIDEIELVLGGGEHMSTGGENFEESVVILHRNDSTMTEEEYVGQHLGENYESDPNQLILQMSSDRGSILLYFQGESEIQLFLSELKIILE